MSFAGRVATAVALAKIEFPGRTVRLCDGAFCYLDGEKYVSRDAVFGTFGATDAAEEGGADMAPGSTLVLLPAPGSPIRDVAQPAMQGARIRWWFGELGADGKTVENAEQIDDGLIDTITPQLGRGTLSLQVATIARAERFFATNTGNTLSPSHHRRVWPGEAGLDNANGGKRAVAWGTDTPPRGTTTTASGGGY